MFIITHSTDLGHYPLFKVQSDLSPYFLRTILGMILLAILGIGVILSNISLDNDLAS